VIALGFVLTDKGIWALVVLAGLTVLSLRDRQKTRQKSTNAADPAQPNAPTSETPVRKARPAQSEAELFRTPEMDEEDAREAGVRLASDLSTTILAVADFDNLEQSEPARSQMVFEANFFAAACVTYQAGKWYSKEPLRGGFVDGLKGQFALILAVATDSMEDATVRSEYESLLTTREQQYRTIRASFHSRLFRLFLGEIFVDEVFLTGRVRFALNQHSVGVEDSVLRQFVKRVVREVHNASGTFSCSPTPS